MKGLTILKNAVCVKCGYIFKEILPAIVGNEYDSHHIWILECLCGEDYEIEYNGFFDECTFLHLPSNKGGPIIYLKDFLDIKKNDPGFVYLMHAKGTRFFKIGRSFDPTQREYQLNNTKSPVEIELLSQISTINAFKAEYILHEYFSNKRTRGEWFELDPFELHTIMSLDENKMNKCLTDKNHLKDLHKSIKKME